MATAAAIDRVVHHAVILEFDVPSYRTDAPQQRGQGRPAAGVPTGQVTGIGDRGTQFGSHNGDYVNPFVRGQLFPARFRNPSGGFQRER